MLYVPGRRPRILGASSDDRSGMKVSATNLLRQLINDGGNTIDRGTLSTRPDQAGLDDLATTAAMMPPGELRRLCAGPAGPLLIARLARMLPTQQIWDLCAILPAPPLDLPQFLVELDVDVDASAEFARARVTGLLHLERLLAELEVPLDSAIVERMALPSSLGRVIDMLVLTCEAAPVDVYAAPSAAQPLLHALEMLDRSSVFDSLLPAELPESVVEMLLHTANQLRGLGAPATAVRAQLLAVQAMGTGTERDLEARRLRTYMLDEGARIPAKLYIKVFNLTWPSVRG